MMKLLQFAKKHPVGDWCKVPAKKETPPVLKLGRMDVPSFVDNRCYCTAVEDQGANPWCAAYTAAAFAENVLWRRDGRIKQIEPEPIYRYAKRHDGDPNGDGTTLNCVLDGLLDAGLFDPSVCKVRSVGRAWVGTDVDDVKAAIHRFGCFLGGFNITEEWYELAGNRGTVIVGNGSPSIGGHAVLVCGFDEYGVWVENSWGTKWGQGGFGHVRWSAFQKQFLYGTVLTNCLNGFR